MRQVEVPLAGSECRRRHQRKLLLVLLGVLEVAGDHLRLVVLVQNLLGLLGLMVGGTRTPGLASLHCQRSGGTSASLHAQLTHPVYQAAVVTSSSSSTSSSSILSGLNTTLQSLLQLPTQLLPIRPEVEEVVALL